MTYFGVLATFILPPLLVLMVIVPGEVWRKWLRRGAERVDPGPYLAILLLVGMAVIYTTPWDNYLVATGVWWYDPALVTGITLGWVPIEEYTFFVVQTLLTGFWVLGLYRLGLGASRPARPNPAVRWTVSALVAAAWAASTAMLVSGWPPGTYLSLILSWALVPLLIQTIYGADILLANLRLVVIGILGPTLYLWWVDSLAITAGTWTIDPAQTTGLLVGPLPIEEMVFFMMTNVIIVFGMTLMLSPESQARMKAVRERLAARRDRGLSNLSTDGPRAD